MSKAVSSADHVLSAEEVGEVARDFSHKLRVPALAASHELLRAERDEERERFHRHVEEMIEPGLLAKAVAGGRAADALRRIEDVATGRGDGTEHYQGGWVSAAWLSEIVRAAVAEYDATAGAAE